MHESDGTTQVDPSLFTKGGLGVRLEVAPALQIAWSVAEPTRVGEVFLLPGGAQPEAGLIGRGAARADDPAVRLLPVRQRPGANVAMGPLASRTLSRQQLLVTARTDGSIDVVNVGRVPLSVRGDRVDRARVGDGDVLVLGRVLVLQVTMRPSRLPTSRSWREEHVPPFGDPDRFGLVGESPATWALRDAIAFTAVGAGHVLLTGESGTGKELAARAIHGCSRTDGPLVSRNAATLPQGLIDAELFGNCRNYPNPGMRDRSGLIGEADGGTLFLDETGELPSGLQVHLLRVLDGDGEYQRLGESKTRRSRFRLVAATNRPQGLKHDLLARFIHRIHLPPLGARRDDIPLMIRHLLADALASDPSLDRFLDESADGHPGQPRVDVRLVEALLRHRYSTHVRELSRLLWMAIAGSTGSTVRLVPALDAELDAAPSSVIAVEADELTAEEILEALDRHEGIQARAWKELGLKNRFQLRRLMKRHGIQASNGGRSEVAGVEGVGQPDEP